AINRQLSQRSSRADAYSASRANEELIARGAGEVSVLPVRPNKRPIVKGFGLESRGEAELAACDVQRAAGHGGKKTGRIVAITSTHGRHIAAGVAIAAADRAVAAAAGVFNTATHRAEVCQHSVC